MRHLTIEELERYQTGDIGGMAKMMCARHLAKCPECADALDKIKRNGELLDELRDAMRPEMEEERK